MGPVGTEKSYSYGTPDHPLGGPGSSPASLPAKLPFMGFFELFFPVQSVNHIPYKTYRVETKHGKTPLTLLGVYKYRNECLCQAWGFGRAFL